MHEWLMGVPRASGPRPARRWSVGLPLLLSAVLVSGCIPGRRGEAVVPPAPVPTSAPVSTPASPNVAASGKAPARADSAATDSTRRGALPATPTDEVVRTAVAVFGDSQFVSASAPRAAGDAAGPAGSSPVAADSADAAEAMDEPSWDLDVRSFETHERVAHYVNLFATRGRPFFSSRLSRGTRYEPMIRAKLRAGGLPEDLHYLALIESGYDPHAYSRAAAVGMWQFMSSTGRSVGLRVDWWMDERRDPARSTDAAIQFLDYLQKQYGSWYLAAAAYNGGPGRIARGLTRFAEEMEGKSSEERFFTLADQNYLRAETKNYVPQLIAAALVAKMPLKYQIRYDTLPPYAYDSVLAVPGTPLGLLVTRAGLSDTTVRLLNPAILRGITPPDASVWLRVPVGDGGRIQSILDSLQTTERIGFQTVTLQGSRTTWGELGARYGVGERQLRWFNPTVRASRGGRLVAGQTVRIPDSLTLRFAMAVPDPAIERYGGGNPGTLSRRGVHVVKRGESLASIARRYGLTERQLRSINGLRSSRVMAGQSLQIRSSRTTASRSTRSSSARKSATASKSSKAKKSTASSRSTKGTAAKKSTPKKAATKKTTSGKSTTTKRSSTRPSAKKGASR